MANKKIQEELEKIIEDEEETIPLETIDRGLSVFEEETVKDVVEEAPVVIPLREITPLRGDFIVDEEMAQRVLTETNYRYFKAFPRVVFLGQGKQLDFVFTLLLNAVQDGGLFVCPEELDNPELLASRGFVPCINDQKGFVVYERKIE